MKYRIVIDTSGHVTRCRPYHSIRHIAKNLVLHANLMDLFHRSGVLADRSFTLREDASSTFSAPVTLTLTHDFHIRTWPVFPPIYRMCENELPASRVSKVIVLQLYECVHLVTRGHFRSRDEDGGHTLDPSWPKTPWHMQTSWLCLLLNRSYERSKFYIAE